MTPDGSSLLGRRALGVALARFVARLRCRLVLTLAAIVTGFAALPAAAQADLKSFPFRWVDITSPDAKAMSQAKPHPITWYIGDKLPKRLTVATGFNQGFAALRDGSEGLCGEYLKEPRSVLLSVKCTYRPGRMARLDFRVVIVSRSKAPPDEFVFEVPERVSHGGDPELGQLKLVSPANYTATWVEDTGSPSGHPSQPKAPRLVLFETAPAREIVRDVQPKKEAGGEQKKTGVTTSASSPYDPSGRTTAPGTVASRHASPDLKGTIPPAPTVQPGQTAVQGGTQHQHTVPAQQGPVTATPPVVATPAAPARPRTYDVKVDLKHFWRSYEAFKADGVDLAKCLLPGLTRARFERITDFDQVGDGLRVKLPLEVDGSGQAPTLFGRPIACAAARNCPSDRPALALPMRGVVFDYARATSGGRPMASPEARDQLWKALRAFGNQTQWTAIACKEDATADYFVIAGEYPPSYPFPELPRSQLMLADATSSQELRTGELIVGDGERGFRRLALLAKPRVRYRIVLDPRTSDGRPMDAADFRQIVGSAPFRVARDDTSNSLPAPLDPTSRGLALQGEVELWPGQEPWVRPPDALSGLVLQARPQRSDAAREITYRVIVPDALIKPVEVRFRPVKRLYGAVDKVSEYPARECEVQLPASGQAPVALQYGRKEDGIVLHQKEGARLSTAAAQALAAGAASASLEVANCTGGARSGSLTVTGLRYVPATRRLTGDIVVPETKRVALGLLGVRTSVPDTARVGEFRDLVRLIASEAVNAIDEGYRRDQARWAAADILVVPGGFSDEDRKATDWSRLVVGGGLGAATPAKASDLKLVASGGQTIDEGIRALPRIKAGDFAAVIERYVAYHTGEEPSRAHGSGRFRVVGIVVDEAKDWVCKQWAGALAKVAGVTVDLLMIDTVDNTAASPEVQPCAEAAGTVKVKRLSLSALGNFNQQARVDRARGALAQFVGEVMGRP